MDIIQVLAANLQANMLEKKFEINQVIQNPLERDALDRLESAVQQFVGLRAQFETVTNFIQEMEKNQNTELDSNESGGSVKNED
jgi:hypothetical protein